MLVLELELPELELELELEEDELELLELELVLLEFKPAPVLEPDPALADEPEELPEFASLELEVDVADEELEEEELELLEDDEDDTLSAYAIFEPPCPAIEIPPCVAINTMKRQQKTEKQKNFRIVFIRFYIYFFRPFSSYAIVKKAKKILSKSKKHSFQGTGKFMKEK